MIGFNGQLRATNSNKSVTWTIQKAGAAFTIDVSAHVALGAVSANGMLNRAAVRKTTR